ncbi:MAG: AAA-associated domain-containing protein, partial [Dehalococcoidia bacterium]|nr:AAA-associated domain-containing protein [Dehalococcoidia bacterium]
MSSRLAKWRRVVEALGLDLSQPVNYVSASAIKRVTGEEPRLMAKIDRRDDVPEIFANAGVFLLPVTNGEYAIVRGEGYHVLPRPAEPPAIFYSRLPFALVSATAGESETQHIDFAFNSGLLERFAGVGNLYLTIRGRKRAPEFHYYVGETLLRASSVQVEVDAGFEGQDHIVVVEGKIGRPDTFHVRQLYFPFRFWQSIAPTKRIMPVFFTYEPETAISTFWEYRFRQPERYDSIELVRAQAFRIQPASDNILPSRSLSRMDAIAPTLGPNIIPQANDVDKIAELPFRVATGRVTSVDLAEAFEFSPRQGRYYCEAAEALGLVTARHGRYKLTALGAEYVASPVQQRHELLARAMFRLPILYELLIALFLSPEKC